MCWGSEKLALHRYKIFASQEVAGMTESKKASKKCLEKVDLEKDLYRLGKKKVGSVWGGGGSTCCIMVVFFLPRLGYHHCYPFLYFLPYSLLFVNTWWMIWTCCLISTKMEFLLRFSFALESWIPWITWRKIARCWSFHGCRLGSEASTPEKHIKRWRRSGLL